LIQETPDLVEKNLDMPILDEGIMHLDIWATNPDSRSYRVG